MLVRLLYASRTTAAIDEALIASILERSRKYNLEHGITGLLCTATPGNVFLQLLEGGRDAVNTLYGNILRDARHTDITLLEYAEISERRFSSWRMGRVNLNRVNQGTILRFSDCATFDPFSMSGSTALALLDELTSTAAIAGAD